MITRCPPDYIKLPPSIACADVDDALIVTMARILGLCWDRKYRRSPPYTPDQLAGLLDRPRTTLYQHLNKLQQLRWLRVDHTGRRLVLQPLVRITEGQSAALSPPGQVGYDFPEQGANDKHELRKALQEAGIVGRPFRELLQRNVDPALVRAWHLWTWAQEQEWMDNPAGYIVNLSWPKSLIRQGSRRSGMTNTLGLWCKSQEMLTFLDLGQLFMV